MSILEQVRRLAGWNTWANHLVGETLRQANVPLFVAYPHTSKRS